MVENIPMFPICFTFADDINKLHSYGKDKIEFIAKITTPDGKEILKCVEEEIPSMEAYNPDDLNEFMSSFDDYECRVLRARNNVCEEITASWFEEQAKKEVFLLRNSKSPESHRL